MKTFKAFLAFTLLFLTGCGTTEMEVPMPSESNSTTPNQQVDEFFAEFVSDNTPGGAVIVVQNGKILHHAAYGLANLEEGTPLTTDHIFHLASVGKQMTALGILMLVEDGSLNLDDPVGIYVPEVAHFGDEFTIRHLLHHTSGLPDYDDQITDALYTRSDTPTNEDLVAALSNIAELPYAPGDSFEYSNPGYDLLAVVIERVSGENFPDFMKSHIFDPAGMTHTFSLPNEKRRADPLVAMSYTNESGTPEAYPYDDLDNLYGSGSIYSTTTDMALYDEALYTEKFVSQALLAEAFLPTELNDGSIEPYGFGWELEEWNGENYVAHSGAWLGFNSDYVRFPERHLSVIVLLNRDYDYPDDPRIALKIAEYFLQ